ncbi:hypothetical protein FQA47_012349 [Oryzias melastigma]|uniref:Uncharacterized protein n=1 Tax=Oryzias melastigma TaxID=30732 RepID=A0A834C611_ORYME|nr:hypothetical protein FQA47_012349 [Oryzias melastigma]
MKCGLDVKVNICCTSHAHPSRFLLLVVHQGLLFSCTYILLCAADYRFMFFFATADQKCTCLLKPLKTDSMKVVRATSPQVGVESKVYLLEKPKIGKLRNTLHLPHGRRHL